LFTVLITALLAWTSYKFIARIFKWLTLALFAYVITAFLARPSWTEVLRATFVPHIQLTRTYMAMLVGILGTTISPYLFFWQAAQEVEEEREQGKRTPREREGATDLELSVATTDTDTGMLYSNLVMYFIILTTGATLHLHGKHDIETAQQAAEALRPLAGGGAYWLFTLGLVGVGMLAVPVLAGSCAYAISEAVTWDEASLNDKPARSPGFYVIIAAAMLIGLALNLARLNAIKMLFWSAILNGVLAPPLVVLVVVLSSDRTVMGDRVNSRWANAMGWICAVAMGAAAIAMFAL
jgi:Mn2+/Fe2+ NRAMP family transporter